MFIFLFNKMFKKYKVEDTVSDSERDRYLSLEKKFMDKHCDDPSLLSKDIREKVFLKFLLTEYPDMSEEELSINAKYILGYGILNPLLDDDDVEEILINSYDKPAFILHRKLGKCRTNIECSKDELEGLIRKIKVFSGETNDKIITNVMLPPITRINIALPPTSSEKPVISMKKFLRNQPSITELIRNRTISVNVATFLWMCVDDWGVESSNILITGGTSSGKTTLLNALLAFCRESERIVSIEDTLELDLSYLDEWVKMKTTEEIDMDELTRNSLRQNPDRIIVGEVRGKEAYSLVAAMNVGRTGAGTIHGNSAREIILRMKSPPMNVPLDMLSVIDLIVVLRRYREGNMVIRKVIGIEEVGNVVGDVLQLGEIYKYDPKAKKTQFRHFPVTIMRKIRENTGLTEKEILKEFSRRMRILKHLADTNVTNQMDFVDRIRSYYGNKGMVLKKTRKRKRSRKDRN